MRKLFLSPLAMVLMLLTTQACARGDEAIAQNLYQAGKVYVYQVGESKTVTLKFRVTSVSIGKDGEKKISTEIIFDELKTSVWSHDNLITGTSVKSSYRKGTQERLFSLPIKPGEEWESSREYGRFELKETRTVRGTEKMDTPIGKMEVIRVDFKASLGRETLTGSRWYAHDGGLIKSEGYVGDLTLRRVDDK